MKFLPTSKAWRRWANATNRGQPQAPISPPKNFPCFGYLRVQSFGYEEEEAEYLYPDDIEKMSKQMKAAEFRSTSGELFPA